MQIRVGVVAGFALLLTFATPVQAATPKAGAKCTKAGITATAAGKKFTCVKSGTKLVWNKGVTIKAAAKPLPNPTPTLTPTPTPTPTTSPTLTPMAPWSINTSKQELTNTAREKFQSWVSIGVSEKLRISIQPGISLPDIQYIIDGLKYSEFVFSQYLNEQPHVYFGVEDSWIISQLKRDYPEHSGYSQNFICYKPNPTAGCAWPNYSLMFFVAKSSQDWILQKQGLATASAHEFFHIIQEKLFSRNIKVDASQTWGVTPQWFIEGGATFMGIAVTDKIGSTNWESERAKEISYYAIGRGRNSPLADFQKNEVDRPQPEGQSLRPYGIGMLACEYIVASVGMDRFLGIYREIGLGKSFPNAFISSTGISLEEFYIKFDFIRLQIGFFPVS